MSKLILGRSIAARRGMGFAARGSGEAGELVTYSGDGHLITFAPTGTGKTSGPVITNGLTHRGQLIVLDMKGEVFAATAQARRAIGQEVCVVDLRDGGKTGHSILWIWPLAAGPTRLQRDAALPQSSSSAERTSGTGSGTTGGRR